MVVILKNTLKNISNYLVVISTTLALTNCKSSSATDNTQMFEVFNSKDSFFNWTTGQSHSFGRWNTESLCVVDNREYVLLSGVFACDVYGEDPLFLDPPYTFQAIFSNEHFKVFRTYKDGRPNADSYDRIDNVFSKTHFEKKSTFTQQLNNFDEIANAAFNNREIICLTRYKFNNQEVTQTFHVKHINISQAKRAFQVETGPIIVWGGSMENSQLGYVAFNELQVVHIIDNNSKITSLKAQIKLYSK